MIKNTFAYIEDNNNDNQLNTSNNQNANLNIPLLNTMINSFTKQQINQTNQNANMKNELIFKELSQEIRDRDDLIKKYEVMSKELILMGFSPTLVLHSFLAFKYQNVEEAIEIMSKNSDNLWIHKYLKGEDDLCFVCDHIENEHRDIKRLSKFSSKPSFNIDNRFLEKKFSFSVKKEPEKEFSLKINVNSCQICFLEVLEDNKFNLICKHQFCKECIIEYLKEEIKNSRVTNLGCPTKDCVELFSDNEIKNLISDEYYYKYRKFLMRAKIKDDNNLVVCPIVDCDEEEKKINKKYTCNNGHNFCSNCNQAWHGYSDCDKDKEIKDFATYSGYIVKKCPQCKVWTEKNEGCNHMTCKICSYNWCWICENECLPDHYMIEGTPCYGKQFNDQNRNENNELFMIFHRDSILVSIFVFYIFTFFIIRSTINNIYHINNGDAAGQNNQQVGRNIVGGANIQNNILPIQNPNNPNVGNNANNNLNIRERPPKITTFLSLLCVNTCILIICLICNAFVFVTILINLGRISQVRNAFAKVITVIALIILFFLLYATGGPLLSILWFLIANFYTILKLAQA
jgi:hypothetical protein